MSIAALHAQALGSAMDLVEGAGWRSELARAYLPEAMRPAEWAWRMGQVNDLLYPEVTGERTEATEALARTVRALLKRASTDAALMSAYGRVIHLLGAAREPRGGAAGGGKILRRGSGRAEAVCGPHPSFPPMIFLAFGP